MIYYAPQPANISSKIYLKYLRALERGKIIPNMRRDTRQPLIEKCYLSQERH